MIENAIKKAIERHRRKKQERVARKERRCECGVVISSGRQCGDCKQAQTMPVEPMDHRRWLPF